MEAAVKAHIGLIRQVNEDSADIITREPIKLALVADGMGGHQAGDVASNMAIQIVKDAFEEADVEQDANQWQEWLISAIDRANTEILQHAMKQEQLHGMGTTIVAVLFLADCYMVAHVGDSRVYRYVDASFQQLTEDHSLVQELLNSGEITDEEAKLHPQRNVITRALGTEESVEIDAKTLTYAGDEYLLLCSDGLSNMLREEQIIEVLHGDQSIEEKASILVEKALEAGGEDNISLILVYLNGDIVIGK